MKKYMAARANYNTVSTTEFMVIFVFSVAVFILARQYDILELLVDFTEHHEHWELDEFLTVAIFLAFALGFFSLHRWRELIKITKVLEHQNAALKHANEEIKSLRGIIPICASCKRIRDDKGYWHQVESYIRDHSEAQFSHGLCPECVEKIYPGLDIDDEL